MRELEEVRQRLRDEEAAREPPLQLCLERAELVGISDRHELRRGAREPRTEIADGVDGDVLELRVTPRLGVELGDVQLVVDIRVQMEAGVEHGVHRLARGVERDRDVEEELAAPRIRNDGSLVTDDRIVAREVRPHGAEHPSRHDDHVGAGVANGREGGTSARPQHAVLRDQRPIEIEGESGDVPREVRRKVYGTVPPVAVTT